MAHNHEKNRLIEELRKKDDYINALRQNAEKEKNRNPYLYYELRGVICTVEKKKAKIKSEIEELKMQDFETNKKNNMAYKHEKESLSLFLEKMVLIKEIRDINENIRLLKMKKRHIDEQINLFQSRISSQRNFLAEINFKIEQSEQEAKQ